MTVRLIRLAGLVALGMAAFSAPAMARTVAEAKASGHVLIGIAADDNPCGFINSSGVQQGFDADVSRAFAKYLGVKPEFVTVTTGNRNAALTTGKVDVVFSCVGVTAERAKAVQYSIPYSALPIAIVAPKDKPIKTAKDLSGLRVGVVRAGVMDIQVTKMAPPDAKIARFDDDASNIQAFLSGQTDAMAATDANFLRLDASSPGKFERKIPVISVPVGAISRLGDKDWNAELNKFLNGYMKDPAYKAGYKKWYRSEMPNFPHQVEGVNFTVTK